MAEKIILGKNGNWGVKENGLLAYNDEDNIFKAIEMDFSRSSTATRESSAGLIDENAIGVPRIDFSDSSDGALLLEPQSTNLVLNSANGSYGGGGSPTSEIFETAPDGTNNAVRPVPSVTTNRYEHTISGGTFSSGSLITYSWYRKRLSYPDNDSFVGDLNITALVNCTQQGSTTEIESNINGYDRFQAVFEITDGSLSTIIRLYYGDVVGVGNSSVAYWGHQVEQKSYATSYIPTSGATATRVAETCSKSGLENYINSSEGVLYAEIKSPENVSAQRLLGLNDGVSISNSVLFGFSSSNHIRFYGYESSGGTGFDQTIIPTDISTDFIKVALKWSLNNVKFFINGVQVGSTDTSFNPTFTLTNLDFDNGNNSNYFYGKVKDLRVYDTALSDSELQTLTTL